MKKKSVSSDIILENGTKYRFDNQTLFITGNLLLPLVPGFTRKVLKEIKTQKTKDFVFNLDGLEDIDSAGVTALFYVKRKLGATGFRLRMEGGSETILKKIELFKPEKFDEPPPKIKTGLFESVGNGVYDFFTSYLYGFLLLAANVFYFALADLFRKKVRRKGEFANQAVLIGVNSVLIVVFMSFVIGLVLALQSAQQLRNFGANIFIVDLVVIGMMSQMGPLITAILVAGRSGSSIAAEIATMKVTSELDALKTMGLEPIRFVVVPKLYASLLTIPFLIVLANVAGITGGGVAAYFYLDITPEIFINRMGGVMKNKDLITAFVKSQVYACLIVLTGSFYGFRVVRGAEGVGKATTSAVVVAISLVIIADSILGLLFY
ncbi:MAG: MlaE family lipid ABC transporter permease subunit [Bacteroidetes bacterium]|nr:MAG: MlaE family lipid ABC transporter permease subunit [Bacteroidota bacterium]